MSNTTQFIPSSSGLIIGTSPVQNTATGRIVFNIDGIAATSNSLTFLNNILEVSGTIKINSPGDFNTHIVQRWRNFAGNADLAKLTGDGALTIGAYTSPNTKLSVTGTTYGIYGSGSTAFFADAGGSGTRIGYDSTARSTTVGGLSIGVRGIADGGGATGINKAVQGQANGSGTNYAGYFDAINGTLNYALFVQRGRVNLGTLPTSSDGLAAGDLFTQTATQLGMTGTTKIICQV